jgi:hypothetical protein
VFLAFFPPRSETSHPFQSVGHSSAWSVVNVGRWLATLDATQAASCSSGEVHAPRSDSAHLYKRPVRVR